MKSENAKAYLLENLEIIKGNKFLMVSTVSATNAIELAEAEIEEKMRDKAIKAFCACCEWRKKDVCPISECIGRNEFIQELNKITK